MEVWGTAIAKITILSILVGSRRALVPPLAKVFHQTALRALVCRLQLAPKAHCHEKLGGENFWVYTLWDYIYDVWGPPYTRSFVLPYFIPPYPPKTCTSLKVEALTIGKKVHIVFVAWLCTATAHSIHNNETFSRKNQHHPPYIHY